MATTSVAIGTNSIIIALLNVVHPSAAINRTYGRWAPAVQPPFTVLKLSLANLANLAQLIHLVHRAASTWRLSVRWSGRRAYQLQRATATRSAAATTNGSSHGG